MGYIQLYVGYTDVINTNKRVNDGYNYIYVKLFNLIENELLDKYSE